MQNITFSQDILFVDLDNTLIRSDLSMEALLRLLRQNPLLLFVLPIWLLKGRAALKARLATQIELDVTSLPYDADLLALLRSQRDQGKHIVLATAAPRAYAEAISTHLQIFDAVLATDALNNLKGEAKFHAIDAYANGQTYAYLGDAHADIAIWKRIGKAYLVRPAPGVLMRLNKASLPNELVIPGVSQRSVWRTLRPWQWLKNVLVFVPLVLAKAVGDWSSLSATIIAFMAFSLTASAGYILNDLLDLEADRAHPRKCHRPFASGEVAPSTGLILALACLLIGSLLSWCVSLTLWLTLLLYFVLVTAYSLEWKQHAILDMLLLAGFYTARLISGAVAAEVTLSFWLMAFAIFLFLSLAAVKRCTELRGVKHADAGLIPGRGYSKHDEPLLFTMGIASGYVSVVVIALYIHSEEVSQLYRTPEILWLVCPLMLYWLSRMWLKTSRQEMTDDPILFAMRDRVSLACAVLLLLLLALASTY